MLNTMILYVGERETGEALAARIEADGGYVYLPESAMQALGMYITYFPNAIVIDTSVPFAQEVYEHLRSVDAEPIFLLTDDTIRSASVFTLPRGSSAESLLQAMARYTLPQPVPNGVLRYA